MVAALANAVGFELVREIPWSPGFLALPGYIPMSLINSVLKSMDCHYFSMDISSAIPSLVLCGSNPNSILDLCCCPGGKLLISSDAIKCDGTVVGVDVSDRRLEICRSVINAYLHQSRSHAHIQLYHADGVIFCASNCGTLFFDSKVSEEEIIHAGGSRKRRNKSSRARERKKLRIIQKSLVERASSRDGEEMTNDGNNDCETNATAFFFKQQNLDVFDSVLVDAQCTHDGSYRHMRYLETRNTPHDSFPLEEDLDDRDVNSAGSITCPDVKRLPFRVCQKPTIHKHVLSKEQSVKPTSDASVYDCAGEERVSMSSQAAKESADTSDDASALKDHSLRDLQRGLILNGFNRLREGGTLVYSTCSMQRDQNEDIVDWLIDTVGAERVETGSVENLCGGAIVTVEPAETLKGDRVHCNYHSALNTLLTSTEEDVHSCLHKLHDLDPDSFRLLASDVCKYVANMSGPPGRPGARPGTAYFGRWGGMSGLFIAHLIKKK